MKILLEIRPGEGGDDAKLLVSDQIAIYAAYARCFGLEMALEDDNRS